MTSDSQDSIDLLHRAVSEEDFERIRCTVEPEILMSRDVSLLGQLGAIFRKKELWRDSEAILCKAIKLYPSLPALHAQMGMLFLYRDDMEPKDSYERSREELELAIKLEEAENESAPSTHTLLGKTYELLEDYENAGAEYQHALEIDPRYSEARYNLAILLRDFIRPSPKERVLALLTQCEGEDPEDFLTLRDLGWQLIVFGQLDEAETRLRRALRLHDDDVSLHVYLGQLKWTQKDPIAAEMHFQRAVSIDPSIGMSHRLLGRFLQIQRPDRRCQPGAVFGDRIRPRRPEFCEGISRVPGGARRARSCG